MATLVVKFVVMEEDGGKRETELENFPRVRFELNPGLDAGKIGEFWAGEGKRRRGPAEFRRHLAEAHPRLGGMEALSPSKRKAKIEAYIADYYRQHEEKLAAAGSQIAYVWDEYAPQFFAAAGRIFPGLAWPHGRYIGFVSITPPFPRWLHDKTFQVPDGPIDRCIRVAAHEMLHFLFYEYVRLRYLPRLENTMEKDMDRKMKGNLVIPLWELSEIFNIKVLTPENFGQGGSEVDSRTQYQWYQHLDPYAPVFEKAWEEAGGDIDQFFAKLEVGA